MKLIGWRGIGQGSEKNESLKQTKSERENDRADFFSSMTAVCLRACADGCKEN